MPSFKINFKQELKGPIFDVSKSKAAAKRMIANINQAIAVETQRRIRARLGQVLRESTGFYASMIVIDQKETTRMVTDSKVAKGGWLEGVDSRNKTTRFPGYRTFRTIKEQMKQDAERIAQPLVEQYVREMNGG